MENTLASQVAEMPRKKRNDTAVKIDVEIARKARTISSYYERSLAEYLSELMKPVVDKEFDKFKKMLEGHKNA